MYFTVTGAPIAALPAYTHGGESGGGWPALMSLVHSSAAVVIADPSQTRLNAGVVAAVAPLMGVNLSPDPKVWKGVGVRSTHTFRSYRATTTLEVDGIWKGMRHHA